MNNCLDCKIKSAAVKTLTSNELQNLGNNCAQVYFKKGDIIFKEGAFSSNIIFLRSGLVKIHIAGPAKNQITKITKAPSFLGIPTTFNEKINHYSATAIELTSVCFIDKDIFKDFIFKNGKFAYEVIVEICSSELSSFEKCVNRTQRNIHGRLANALLSFAEDIYGKDEFEMPLSRVELGNFVDTSRESVCRILTEFNNDKLIQLNGKSIKILNRESLEAIRLYG